MKKMFLRGEDFYTIENYRKNKLTFILGKQFITQKSRTQMEKNSSQEIKLNIKCLNVYY